jgi:hypothetical protein
LRSGGPGIWGRRTMLASRGGRDYRGRKPEQRTRIQSMRPSRSV